MAQSAEEILCEVSTENEFVKLKWNRDNNDLNNLKHEHKTRQEFKSNCSAISIIRIEYRIDIVFARPCPPKITCQSVHISRLFIN